METDDLKLIKKYYGEKMSHLCRDLFPTILEQNGVLFRIISEHFIKSNSLYYDIINENKEMLFKDYVYNFFDDKKTNKEIVTKSAKELLEEQGYVLYECKSFEDVLKFKKYYAPNEELCTFRDPHRIDNHHIFFIVKNDVENIKREDFKNPKREDKYGVSVLDLQFDKGVRQRVSIKSRYNHRVNNPDATYSNNLEYIAPGLTEAFEKDYCFNIGSASKIGFDLRDYIEAIDGMYYKYNYEINNIYYCLDNIIIDDGKVIDTYVDKSRYTFMDYFILDEVEKKIIRYDKEIYDSFVDDLQDIEQIDIRNNKEEECKEVRLKLKGDREAIIKLDKRGRIISYKNDHLKECGFGFLYYNTSLTTLDLPELEKFDDYSLYYNDSLTTLSLPKLKRCGSYFLNYNEILKSLNLPKLEECGYDFLYSNDSLISLSLPNLKKIWGDNFLCFNSYLTTLDLPELEKCGDSFLSSNISLSTLDLPKLKRCGDYFLKCNEYLTSLKIPMLEVCGHSFLYSNKSLTTLYFPKLKKISACFLFNNDSLTTLDLPEVEECDDAFLYNNTSLTTLKFPKLKECNNYFLYCNTSLSTIDLPELEKCGECFLYLNTSLTTLNLPKLEVCDKYFLYYNTSLTTLNLPKLKECGHSFLYSNKSLTSLTLPKLESCGKNFLHNNPSLLTSSNIPNINKKDLGEGRKR